MPKQFEEKTANSRIIRHFCRTSCCCSDTVCLQPEVDLHLSLKQWAWRHFVVESARELTAEMPPLKTSSSASTCADVTAGLTCWWPNVTMTSWGRCSPEREDRVGIILQMKWLSGCERVSVVVWRSTFLRLCQHCVLCRAESRSWIFWINFLEIDLNVFDCQCHSGCFYGCCCFLLEILRQFFSESTRVKHTKLIATQSFAC